MGERVRPNDAAAMAQLAEGNPHGLVALCDRYEGPLLSLARAIVGQGLEAEEVVQDALLHLWRRPSRYRPRHGTVASHLILEVRRLAVAVLTAQPELADQGPVGRFVWAKAKGGRARAGGRRPLSAVRRTARQAIRHLDSRQRRILEALYFRGQSLASLAAELEMGPQDLRQCLATVDLDIRQLTAGSGGHDGPYALAGLLYPYLLGALPEAEAARAMLHLEGCTRCTARLAQAGDDLALLALALTPAAPVPWLREGLVHALGEMGRFTDLVPRLTHLLACAAPDVEAELARLDRPQAWAPTAALGVSRLIDPSPHHANWLRASMGTQLRGPAGPGRGLVLQGSGRAADGRLRRAGDRLQLAHDLPLRALDGPDLICVVCPSGTEQAAHHGHGPNSR